MTKTGHLNNGLCLKCLEIASKYKGIYEPLWSWFNYVQLMTPDAHISEAGRGREKQELFKRTGASRASYGHSAHNYNAAIDIFRMKDGKAVYEKKWYEKNIISRLELWIKWYGEPGSKFYELPHFEVYNWRQLALDAKLSLVE